MTEEQEQEHRDTDDTTGTLAMTEEESDRRSAPPPYSPPSYVNPPTAPPADIIPPKIFGPNPLGVKCSNCQQQVTTSLVHAYGSCTIIASVSLFIIFFPCFWLPLVLEACKDVHHMCPSCNAHLGTHKVI